MTGPHALALLGVIVAIGTIVIALVAYLASLFAPIGHEDSSGFHHGQPGEDATGQGSDVLHAHPLEPGA